jgi:D-alanine-D-alanine ligase
MSSLKPPDGGSGPSSLKIYDFAPNYSDGGSNRIQPAPDLPFVYQEVRRLTLAAHVALGCRA